MSTATAGYVFDSTEFVHRGKRHKIFRRTPQGNFQVRKEIGGEKLWKTLDTPIRSVAIANAKAWLDQVQQCKIDGKWGRLDPLRSKSPWPTIGEIVERYLERAPGAVRITTRSAAGNVSSLRSVLSAAHATQEPDTLTADVLTEATVRKFVEVARASGRSESGIRSTLVQARSVFGRALLYIYEGMRLPELDGFRVSIRFESADDIGFEPIPQHLLDAMESAALALRAADPATWLCYMMMSRLGMRNVEVERATLEWLNTDATGVTRIHIPETKGGRARLLALPEDLTLADIRAIAGDGPEIIPAPNATYRRDICQRAINRFVKRYLTDREDGAYELRKWAGSLVWTEQGCEAAQSFLGHRSMATTERYYARFLRPVRAVSPADRESIARANAA